MGGGVVRGGWGGEREVGWWGWVASQRRAKAAIIGCIEWCCPLSR